MASFPATVAAVFRQTSERGVMVATKAELKGSEDAPNVAVYLLHV